MMTVLLLICEHLKQVRFLDVFMVPGDHKIAGKASDKREFTVRSTYRALEDGDPVTFERVWKTIASYCTLPRIKCCIWISSKERLLNNVKRAWRLMSTYTNYVSCGALAEDVNHILRTCPSALLLWINLIRPSQLEDFLTCNLQEWIRRNPEGDSYRGDTKTFGVSHSTKLQSQRSLTPATINTDGAHNITTGEAACGRVIRDCRGNWKSGFSKRVGICSSMEAKLWGIFEVLRIAWRCGAKKAVLETESKDATQVICDGNRDQDI
ncbi:hypothetical protein F3Y22_tig00111996pilonHSYRG00033 [Hibiscus syriacus]|uniref:RNase H type-1 domain-containing protein n=1 Tax=Hibiscus syriacus TaxID=106335 RepID=A0A6A2YEB8_HIBSY|nr:hypothetical protein F3Y22_tig00111996pilonHSYRG00033 [Hibiscus syriacus]